jgi:hypothetical protein
LIILILILIYIHFIKQVPILEGMTVNPEALANLSSMYKNGKLKVSELEVTGNIKANDIKANNIKAKGNIDSDGTGRFGVAKIGNWVRNGNYAVVAHKDKFDKEDEYAFMHHMSGETYVNASTDKNINLCIKNTSNVTIENDNVETNKITVSEVDTDVAKLNILRPKWSNRWNTEGLLKRAKDAKQQNGDIGLVLNRGTHDGVLWTMGAFVSKIAPNRLYAKGLWPDHSLIVGR